MTLQAIVVVLQVLALLFALLGGYFAFRGLMVIREWDRATAEREQRCKGADDQSHAMLAATTTEPRGQNADDS